MGKSDPLTSLRSRFNSAVTGALKEVRVRLEQDSTAVLLYDEQGYATSLKRESEQGSKIISVSEQIVAISIESGDRKTGNPFV